MRIGLLLFLNISITLSGLAQSPDRVSFQAVIRSVSGSLVVDQPLGIRLSILQGNINGQLVYQEIHEATTNGNGLVNLEIGGGNPVVGIFGQIDWSNGPYFIKREVDPTGGSNYSIMGTSQILSVPYAQFASVADTVLNLPSGQDFSLLATKAALKDSSYQLRSEIPTKVSNLTNDSGYLTSEVDASTTNELQVLSISNDTIYLSNGGFAKLPGDSVPSIANAGQLLFRNQNRWDTIPHGKPGQYLVLDENGLPKWGGAEPPTVATKNISLIGSNSAFTGGKISNNGGGGTIELGVVWSTNQNPTLIDNKIIGVLELDSFEIRLEGLNPNTTYYLRAYATSSEGTSYGDEISFTTISSVSDIDGNSYEVIPIGNQYWMTGNLKVGNYRDGVEIPSAYVRYPDNDLNNVPEYGRLYNGSALTGDKLCPTGWHIPTRTDWNDLSTTLGGYEVAGGKLKATESTYWGNEGVGTDDFGFKAIPAGYNYRGSAFYQFGAQGIWWSSTSSVSGSNYYRIMDSSEQMSEGGGASNNLQDYLSIRCVKD